MNYYTELAEYVNSKGPLDVCSAGFADPENSEKAFELIKSGLFLPFDDLLASEEGRKLVDLYDEKLWDSVKVDGITYTVPKS